MSAVSETTLLRFGSLLWPAVLLALAVLWRRPEPRLAGAALIATAWNVFMLLVVHGLAVAQGWWGYQAQGGLLLGMPGDLLIGWALLWGAIPVLGFRNYPVWWPLVLAVAVDLLAMPLCAPLVVLGSQWLWGEGVAVLLALVPGLVLARCIERKTLLGLRVLLLVVAYTGVMFFVLPSLILEQTGGSWQHVLGRSRTLNGVFFQVAFLLAVPALSAVQEFFQHGAGTPLPFDPPRRLVTSGPYAYIANPMQTVTVLLLLWGWLTGSVWVAGASFITLSVAAGIAGWNESGQLQARFGAAWHGYRSEVRNWIPRWRPRVWVPCTLYVAENCQSCSDLARWLRARNPTGLRIVPAEEHPTTTLSRIRYEAPGWSEDGVLAFARALEHLHFGWAWMGWTIRLPVVSPILQWIVDLSGGGERPIPRR